ncbi:hypothetical protein CK203_041013 [Vitis vinifera]|uniref:Uncharacterized protein n=1 Tax=Vitis vinifera TaxID=29760 RepID=A0A438H9P9_VITVI|nr:hypothetical protein CK203_041013 [Vitis vinifera]
MLEVVEWREIRISENENLEGPSSSETEIGRRLGRASVRDVKEVMASFRNVKELMDAGIRIKRNPTRHLRDISFRSNGITACLRIPPITIDNSTKAMFLNLIAYEMSSDVDHDFISYLRFLDSLIDHADDVKELQSIGIPKQSRNPRRSGSILQHRVRQLGIQLSCLQRRESENSEAPSESL